MPRRDLATFLVAAPDQPGLVARLAGFFAERSMNIVDAQNHTDLWDGGGPRFYMRLVVDHGGLTAPARTALGIAFGDVGASIGANWSVGYADVMRRVAMMVTKESACLYDLILRQRAGELDCEIAVVISNHPTLEAVARGFDIPFVVLPITPETKRAQETQVLAELAKHDVSLVVLARYMQVLTGEFLDAAPPVINIHHGFLPAFQGGRPYHQAHARGVKMIGATAHYATSDLDQGPILEQDVARVSHALGPDEMARVGRDVERVVLARAVRAHLERRVIVEGRRTVVL
jgi:formyltetrahydrofolate deformylase